jgi:hypothetical protein
MFDIGAKFVNAIISSQDMSAFGETFSIIFQWEQIKYVLPIIGSLVTTVGIVGATGYDAKRNLITFGDLGKCFT